MSMFSLATAASVALLAVAGAASAGQPVALDKAAVYVCERPTLTRHVTHRDHGRMSFVSARQLLTDPAPTAKPRCITAEELARYKALTAQRTQTIASR